MLQFYRSTGRTKIFDELRHWPTTVIDNRTFSLSLVLRLFKQTVQVRNAFEGFSSHGKSGSKKDNTGMSPNKLNVNEGSQPDRTYFHVADEILQHFESGLKSNMKPR